jgi:hypothetical protein
MFMAKMFSLLSDQLCPLEPWLLIIGEHGRIQFREKPKHELFHLKGR